MFIKILSPRRTGFDPGPVCFPCIFPPMLHTYHLNITYIRRTSGRDLTAFSGYRGTFVRKVFSHCFSSLQRVRVHMFWCCFSVCLWTGLLRKWRTDMTGNAVLRLKQSVQLLVWIKHCHCSFRFRVLPFLPFRSLRTQCWLRSTNVSFVST
jgi:hypothetical protein